MAGALGRSARPGHAARLDRTGAAGARSCGSRCCALRVRLRHAHRIVVLAHRPARPTPSPSGPAYGRPLPRDAPSTRRRRAGAGHRDVARRGGPPRGSAGQVTPARRQLGPRSDRGDPALDQHHDPVGLRERRPLGGRADDRRRPARAARSTARSRWRRRARTTRRRPAAARRRRPGARASARRCTCPPESRTPRWPTSASGPPAASTSAPSRAVSSAGRDRPVGVVELHVGGERAGAAPAAPARRGRPGRGAGSVCGSSTRLAVPPDLAGAGDQAGQRARAGWTCPSRPGRAAAPARRGAMVEVDVADADRAVVVHRGEARPARGVRSGSRGPGAGSGRGAVHQVDAGGQLHQVAAAGEPAGGVHPGPGARRLGDDRAGDPAEPVEAVDGAGHQQRGREPPAAGEQHRPRGDDAALHHHDRDAVEHRLHPVLPDRGVDAAAVDVAQVRVHARGGGGELDGAHRVQRRDQRAAEPAPGPPTRPPPTGRRPGGPSDEASAEATITASSTPPASRLCATQRGDAGDGEAVDEVDPAVGVAGQPVGVHRARDDLARRRPLEAVLGGLPGEHGGAAPAASPRSTSAGSGGTRRPAAAARPAARPPARRSARPGCRRPAGSTTRWPQIQPVIAPKAPVRARDEEQPMPTRPHWGSMSSAESGGAGQARDVAQPGGAGGSPVRRAVPTAPGAARPGPGAAACVLGGRLEQGAERAGLAGQPRRAGPAARPGRRRAPRPARRARSWRAGGRPGCRCGPPAAAPPRGRRSPR